MTVGIICTAIIGAIAILATRSAMSQRKRADRLNALVGVLRTGHDELLSRLEYEHTRRMAVCAKLGLAADACAKGDASALFRALGEATDVTAQEMDTGPRPAQDGAP